MVGAIPVAPREVAGQRPSVWAAAAPPPPPPHIGAAGIDREEEERIACGKSIS